MFSLPPIAHSPKISTAVIDIDSVNKSPLKIEMKLRVENKTKTMLISRSDYQTDIIAASTKSSDDIDSAKSCRFLNKQKQCRFPALISKTDIKAASTTSLDDIDSGRSF